MHYQIKLASFKEIQLMAEWAAIEKWNPGLKDANVFQLIDLHGFFVGYLGDEAISCISTVKYTPEFSFLGFYIVKPEYRGQGFGYQIWQHAMKYAGQSNVGLDGVVAQQANYKKSGFQLAHKNIRYLLPGNLSNYKLHPHIIPANVLPINDIALYDRACFPCERNAFLAAWLLMENAISLVYFDQKIKGYGVIRACQQGYKVGPLFADNLDVAQALFVALVSAINKKQADIYLDIPENNLQAAVLVREFAMEPVFETARMYTKHSPKLAQEKIFGISCFEVG